MINRRDFLKNTLAVGGAAALPLHLPKEAEAVRTPEKVFRTGFSTLDSLLDGGFRPGELAIVLGETGAGKTAFCRTVVFVNNTLSDSLKRRYRKDGNNDLLIMSPNGGYIFTADYDIYRNNYPYQSEHDWGRPYTMARHLRELAVKYNEAIIWTVPASRIPSRGICYAEWVPSFIRCADCCILIKNQKKACLIKNRHGLAGDFPVDFISRQLLVSGYDDGNKKSEVLMVERIP